MNTNISVLITSQCTLNCKYCSSGIPYHKERRHIPAEKVLGQIEKILALYTAADIYIEHLDLLGGEPLLHPELADIIDGVCQHRDVFHELRILTNGTLLPQKALIETIKRKDIPFLMIVSDYGALSPKAAQVCGTLETYGLPYRVDRYHDDGQYFGGWVSYGQDGILTGTAEQRYQGCAFRDSGTVEAFQECLYPCVKNLALHATGRSELPAEDYIDLRDDFDGNVKKLLSFTTRTAPYAACETCTGLCANALRYPAAEQMCITTGRGAEVNEKLS